jgi:ribonuclease HI
MPIIATDGSSLGTPLPDGTRKAEGHGGWSAVIQFEEDHPIAPGFVQELIGGKRRTTTGEVEALGFMNALMAIQAYRQALEIDPDNAIITEADRFTIVCDSQYVVKTYSEHLSGWVENKWRKSTRGAIAHQVIWQEIAELRDEIGSLVTVVHQKGHTKRASDETVDPLVEVNDMADRAAGIVSRHIRDTGFVPQPEAIVWRPNAYAFPDRDADMTKLRLLAERVLRAHGRNAAVECFRLATHNTGVRE